MTVPSGLLTACLLAGSPTRSSPSFVKATTDGNIFPATVTPSAEGMMTGFPPSMTAAWLFDVPKSIPMIFSFGMVLLPGFLRVLCDLHLGWPYHLRSEQVPLLELLKDNPVVPVALLPGDGLVEPGVKGPPDALDGRKTGVLEEPAELPRQKPESFPVLFSLEAWQGLVQIVEDREEARHQGFPCPLDGEDLLLLQALPVVVEFGLEVLELREAFLGDMPRILQFSPEAFDPLLRILLPGRNLTGHPS